MRRSLTRATAERLDCHSPLIPKYRHQRKNEISLIQTNTFTVDADEYVGHLFFIHRGRNLQSSEGIFLQVDKPVQIVGYGFLIDPPQVW